MTRNIDSSKDLEALVRGRALDAQLGEVPSGYDEFPNASVQRRAFDVCVIGSGAAGSVFAAQCAVSGLDVLILERGPYPGNVSYDEIVGSSEPAYARDAKGCWGLTGYPWTTCNVGGGTVFYGGAAFRYRRVDFSADGFLGDGDLPADWPYSYDELAPFYAEVEHLVGVSGDATGDPSHPEPTAALPLPPIGYTSGGLILRRGGERLGLHGFPTPLAIASRPYHGRIECDQQRACMEKACRTHSKGSAYSVFLRNMLGLENVTLLSGMAAARLVRDNPHSVARVEAIHTPTKAVASFSARVFVLAANAIQSAALLLRSGDRWARAGIGNSKGLVGCGLSFKLNEYVEGYVPDDIGLPDEGRTSGPFSSVSFTDFYIDSASPAGLGGLIYENQYPFDAAMREPQRLLRLECLIGDQPVRRNQVRLSKEKGELGLPYLTIDYQTHPRDAARLEYLIERMADILRASGAKWIRRVATDYAAGSSHLHGTIRGGSDSLYSAADSDGRLYEAENVYVADGAFMPFAGGVNPTLTIQAHALRAARKVVARL